LRKLTTQKRENDRENNRVSQRRTHTRLSGLKKTARTWGNSQEETWAERQEESGCDDQVGLRQDKTHRLRDETVDEEEHERVEHNSHLRSLSVCEFERTPIGGQEDAWAERQKKSGWNGNFLGCDIWEHG